MEKKEKMKKQKKVKIYQDPLTEQKYEGEAILIKQIGALEPHYHIQRWLVRFDDGMEVERDILVK